MCEMPAYLPGVVLGQKKFKDWQSEKQTCCQSYLKRKVHNNNRKYLPCLGNNSICLYIKLTKALFRKSLLSCRSLPKSFIAPWILVGSVIRLCWHCCTGTVTAFA